MSNREVELGPEDLLVSAAGSGTQASWEQVDAALWNRSLTVNVSAPFYLAQALRPAMVERGFGGILFVSSIAALNGIAQDCGLSESWLSPSKPM